MSRCWCFCLNLVWGCISVLELAFGAYLIIEGSESLRWRMACWLLATGTVQALGVLTKECEERQQRPTALSVWLNSTLIIAVFPLSIACCGVGTYLFKAVVDTVLQYAGIGVFLVFAYLYSIMLVVWIIRFVKSRYLRRRESLVSPGLLAPEYSFTHPLSNEEITKIPEFRATESHGDCPICLDSIKKDTKIKQCPRCFNHFHSICINKVLMSNPLCPMCRENWRVAHELV